MPKSSKAAPKKAKPEKNKSLESWIWDAVCSIRGAKDAPKYKDFIHDMEGTIEIGDTFKNPKFRKKGKLRTFDRVVAKPRQALEEPDAGPSGRLGVGRGTVATDSNQHSKD